MRCYWYDYMFSANYRMTNSVWCTIEELSRWYERELEIEREPKTYAEAWFMTQHQGDDMTPSV